MTTAKQQRRAAKKQRTERSRQIRVGERAEARGLNDRYVCDRCGLEQEVAHSAPVVDETHEVTSPTMPWVSSEVNVAPCEGPLGLECGGETATMLDQHPEGPYA